MSHGESAIEWLGAEEAAQRLGITTQTLYQWRCRGVHLVSYKIGGRVAYDAKDVQAFIEKSRSVPISA